MANESEKRQPGEPPEEMTRLFLGLLEKGPTWTAESTPEVLENQRQHLALLQDLHEQGVILLAGPIPDGEQLRGIVICQAETADEVRAHFEGDAHFQSDRLRLEVHPWLVDRKRLSQPLLPGGL